MNTIVMFVAASLLLVGCGGKMPVPQDPGLNNINVKVIRIQTEQRAVPVTGSGIVSSDTEARLSFKTGNIIERIYVEEGQKVAKGQLLASLNHTEINAQVIQATEAYHKTQRDVQRVENLYADSVATLEQLQNATTAFNVAKQALDIARYNQAFSEIRAPTDGVIIQKVMNEGELVSPGMPVIVMQAVGRSDWSVKMGIPDKDWVRLSVGNKATVTIDAYPGKEFQAHISKMRESADQGSGVYQIELKLRTDGVRLASGMFARANITPAHQDEYKVIPVESIVDGQGASAYVYIPQTNHVRKIPITIASIQDHKVLVQKGLEGLSEVIKDGAGYLTEHSIINLE